MPKTVTSSDYEGSDRRQNGDLPWWLRGILTLGVTSAIAIFLVWVGATEVPKIKAAVDDVKSIAVQNQLLLQEHKEQTAASYRMLQRICSRLSKTEGERQDCFDK